MEIEKGFGSAQADGFQRSVAFSHTVTLDLLHHINPTIAAVCLCCRLPVMCPAPPFPPPPPKTRPHTPTALQTVGDIHFTVQFMPFEDPQFDDDIELTPVKTGEWSLRVLGFRVHGF